MPRPRSPDPHQKGVSSRLTQEEYDRLISAYPAPRWTISEALRDLVRRIPETDLGRLEAQVQDAARDLETLRGRLRDRRDEEAEERMRVEEEARAVEARAEAERLRIQQLRRFEGQLKGWLETAVADPQADPAKWVGSLPDLPADVAGEATGMARHALQRRRAYLRAGGPGGA